MARPAQVEEDAGGGGVTAMPWVRDVHAGGVKIPPAVQERTRARVLAHAAKHYAGRYDRFDLRFRGALCYIDAYTGGADAPTHPVRPRYFAGADRWSVASYTYSHESYEPTFYPDGKDMGTPEAALDIGAVYLGG